MDTTMLELPRCWDTRRYHAAITTGLRHHAVITIDSCTMQQSLHDSITMQLSQ
ncbi:hypothetical protein DPMN_144665 [Dreissena polymorpha]|uniref:Uncharacterized protein n=1 Tax=Dreissena polymorpha TaxID=45954 RepID=A0A9D4F2J7_DREPO|nr:hypothetical protein DPMN_144665 [Dreissena polymorpha]